MQVFRNWNRPKVKRPRKGEAAICPGVVLCHPQGL
jgi:hypothetical protein